MAKMDQRLTYNIYDEPIVVWDVTEDNGHIDVYTNYDQAYRRTLWLDDHARFLVREDARLAREAARRAPGGDLDTDPLTMPLEDLEF